MPTTVSPCGGIGESDSARGAREHEADGHAGAFRKCAPDVLVNISPGSSDTALMRLLLRTCERWLRKELWYQGEQA